MPSVGFDQAAEYYDSTRGFAEGVAERIRNAIVDYTKADLQTRFLELGVGTGRIALPFIKAGYNYTGVDISQAMMDQLSRKLAADATLDPAQRRYRLLQGDVTDLPFGDDEFDVAIAVHVLHLVDGWQKALQEARRVLVKPGGYMIIAHDSQDESATDSPNRIVNRQWESILKDLGVNRETLLPGLRNAEWGHSDESIEEAIRTMGGQPQSFRLVEHQTLPLSVRQMAQRHVDRMYSRDWLLPDAVHVQAVEQLHHWLTSYPDPDRAVSLTAQFKAIITRW